MKVLIVTESYWPNFDGGALFERRLVGGLIDHGHRLTVWTPGKDFSNYTEQDGNYLIYRERAITFFANNKYKVSFAPFLSARRRILADKPDVIHIHNFYWMGLSALFWAKRYHIPVVATNHFMPENALLNFKNVRWLYRPLHRLIWTYLVWIHNRVNFVTSPTPTAVQLLLDHGLKTPAKPVSNGIDTAVFKPGIDPASVIAKYHLPTDRPILLYVGRIDGEKRLDLIVSALPLILTKQPVHLVFAGAGIVLDTLQQQAKQLAVTEHITWTGFLDEADKPLLYNAAQVFVISSPAELQSIVTLEAMATALPIVSVDIAALKELCHDGENGYLFPADDYQALASRTLAILADPKLRASFGTESKHIVDQHHATEVTFEEYAAVYAEVAGK